MESSARRSSLCWLHWQLELAIPYWSSAASWWDWGRYYWVLMSYVQSRWGDRILSTSKSNAIIIRFFVVKRARVLPFLLCTPCWLSGLHRGREVKWRHSFSQVIVSHVHYVILNDVFRTSRCPIRNGYNFAAVWNPLRAWLWWWMADSILRIWYFGCYLVFRLDAAYGRLSESTSHNF